MSEHMTGGYEMGKISCITLGEHAKGTIEAREDQVERLEEFTDRVGSGEFHVATSEVVASACIDGRCGGTVRPNAAGGTNTLAVAYDLLNDIDMGYLPSYRHVASRLKELGLPVGGHDDTHADDLKSGCGACDRLTEIYEFMATNANHLRDVSASLGVSIDDEAHERMNRNAEARHKFPTGVELKGEVEASDGTVDHLQGEHNEVIAIINMRAGATLDRDAVAAEFGPNYEAFNVDAWAFEAAARAIVGDDEQAVSEMVAAQIRYNLATAHVLCGPNMRVVVLN